MLIPLNYNLYAKKEHIIATKYKYDHELILVIFYKYFYETVHINVKWSILGISFDVPYKVCIIDIKHYMPNLNHVNLGQKLNREIFKDYLKTDIEKNIIILQFLKEINTYLSLGYIGKAKKYTQYLSYLRKLVYAKN